MNSRAFFPFRKPVKLICIILASGFYNTHIEDGDREREQNGGGEELNMATGNESTHRTERMGSDWPNLTLNTKFLNTYIIFTIRCLLGLF